MSDGADRFSRFYDEHVDAIYRYCRLRLSNPADAEDATAVIFTKAFAAFPPDHSSSLRSWLFTIAHNEVVNHIRARKVRSTTQSLDGIAELPDLASTPEEEAIRADEANALRNALLRLPSDQQRVIELRLAGLTGPEIAETLARSQTAIRMLQYRAMQQLRTILIDSDQPLTEEKRDAQQR